jgi:hypothetical protein
MTSRKAGGSGRSGVHDRRRSVGTDDRSSLFVARSRHTWTRCPPPMGRDGSGQSCRSSGRLCLAPVTANQSARRLKKALLTALIRRHRAAVRPDGNLVGQFTRRSGRSGLLPLASSRPMVLSLVQTDTSVAFEMTNEQARARKRHERTRCGPARIRQEGLSRRRRRRHRRRVEDFKGGVYHFPASKRSS